jgi:hypothetical protein
MNWWPGWGSIEGANWWGNAFFWASIVSLFFLGVSEVISHRYTLRSDFLVSEEQTQTKKDHEAELARLHLETSRADEKAAAARLETETIRRGVAWRFLSGDQKARITSQMAQFKGQKFAMLTYRIDDQEAANLSAAIEVTLTAAGWIPLPAAPLSWLDSGVSVETAHGDSNVPRIAAKLVDSLNAEKIVTKRVLADKYSEHADVIFVVVAKKPPSGLDLPNLFPK